MFKKISIPLFALIASFMFPSPAKAETVLERVAKTGTLTVATRTDVVPYSYIDNQGELVGYSLDLVELIRKQIEKELGRKVEVKLIGHDSFDDRMQSMISQQVDLSCDNVFTWERDKYVDFSVAYGISGIKLMTKTGRGLDTPESLKDKKIGIIKTSLNEKSIKAIESEANVIFVDSIEAGIDAVKNDTVDAFAFDAVILEGMRQTLDQPDDYQVLPEQSFFKHGIACMVPNGDSSFLHLVDYTLVKFMEGYVTGNPTSVEIINRYFSAPPQGIVEFAPETIKNFFNSIIMTREQIPLDE
jgi:polar amino acid transport system substrate-binding protein